MTVIESSKPDTPDGAFWQHANDPMSQDWANLVGWISSRYAALVNVPGWAMVFIGHTMEYNQQCGKPGGVVLGGTHFGDDNPYTDLRSRWTVMFADDLKHAAEACLSSPRPGYKTVFAWSVTHELGHQIAGLTHADFNHLNRHQAIPETYNNGQHRVDVMDPNIGNLVRDMNEKAQPVFCYGSNRKGDSYTGAPPQPDCADNIFRLRETPQ